MPLSYTAAELLTASAGCGDGTVRVSGVACLRVKKGQPSFLTNPKYGWELTRTTPAWR